VDGAKEREDRVRGREVDRQRRLQGRRRARGGKVEGTYEEIGGNCVMRSFIIFALRKLGIIRMIKSKRVR
jgi:hypothetical protein